MLAARGACLLRTCLLVCIHLFGSLTTKPEHHVDAPPMPCRRYERANKPAGAFLADIGKFRDLSEEVLTEEQAGVVRFLRLDCGPLKQVIPAAPARGSAANTYLERCLRRGRGGHCYIGIECHPPALPTGAPQMLASHCEEWVGKFQALLHDTAARQLATLSDALLGHTAALGSEAAGQEQLQVGSWPQQRCPCCPWCYMQWVSYGSFLDEATRVPLPRLCCRRCAPSCRGSARTCSGRCRSAGRSTRHWRSCRWGSPTTRRSGCSGCRRC